MIKDQLITKLEILVDYSCTTYSSLRTKNVNEN
jgi:hypothetical protein